MLLIASFLRGVWKVRISLEREKVRVIIIFTCRFLGIYMLVHTYMQSFTNDIYLRS
jgi:hypothetical protein